VITQLRDGTPLIVRPIRPDDKRLLARGLSELSPASVQRRFLAPKPSFTSSELRYLTEVDGHDHVALVALDPADPTRLVGVARWVRLHDDPDAAEIAIVVGDPWQGRGVGTLLAEAVAEEARVQGVRRFTATMQSDNVPAQRLMARLTDHLERHHGGGGVSELVLDLAA
jgi:RimJ/RimL family protein N-acetyltransferase